MAAENKKPDWFMLGLVVTLVVLFVCGQWLVFTALDGRIASLESRLDVPTGQIDAKLDSLRDSMMGAPTAEAKAAPAPVDPASADPGSAAPDAE